MNETTNRALMIGVAIFVTLSITSAIFVTINQIKGIYKYVYNTDISLKGKFSEFQAYEGGHFTGLDVINTVKKYRGNQLVKVNYGNLSSSVTITLDSNDMASNIPSFSYSAKYKSDLKTVSDTYIIIFEAE